MSDHATYKPEIKDCIRDRLDAMIAQHCKVLFVRFDVRFPAGTVHQGPNIEVSCLMRALKTFYINEGIATHYVWVREQWSSDAPHYHAVMLLNGSKVQNSMGIWVRAADIWSRITNGPHALVHQCRKAFLGQGGSGSIMIRRPSGTAIGHDLLVQQQAFQAAYEAALEWGSYLAKDFSKGNAPFRVREHDSSRL